MLFTTSLPGCDNSEAGECFRIVRARALAEALEEGKNTEINTPKSATGAVIYNEDDESTDIKFWLGWMSLWCAIQFLFLLLIAVLHPYVMHDSFAYLDIICWITSKHRKCAPRRN